jgi:hypothetical protein
MATLEDRLQTLRGYVETYTSRPAYIADEAPTQPDLPYCTVKLINIKTFHHDTKRDIDGITEEVRGNKNLTYSIQAIGGDDAAGTGASQVLERLSSSFEADVPKRVLTDQEIGIIEVGDVTDISTVVGSIIEDRALINITLNASVPEVFDYESATDATIEVDTGVDPVQTITIPPDEPACPV